MAKPTAAMTSSAAAVEIPTIIGNESSGGVGEIKEGDEGIGGAEVGDGGREGEGDEEERDEGEGYEGEGGEGEGVGQTAIKHDKMSRTNPMSVGGGDATDAAATRRSTSSIAI